MGMSLSAGPDKKFMMLRMMLLSAQLRLRRSVKMKHLDTPPPQSAPSGQEKFAVSPRRTSRSTLPSLVAPMNQENFVPLQDADSSKEPRSVMTKLKLLFRMPPRRNVPWSPKEPVVMSPSWFPSSLPKKSVLMFPRRSVPDQEQIQERSRSPLSRNGAIFHPRSLAWHRFHRLFLYFNSFILPNKNGRCQ